MPASTLSIPGYRIVGKLGEGAMGAVYRARQLSMDRDVAIKILAPDAARDGEFIERFQREARAVSRLHHVNLVSGIDVGRIDGMYYLVMEYVDGVPLSDILERRAPLPEAECLSITAQLARGLAHAHAQGIVHRDVKPENILMTPKGVARLCDLGLAKRVRIDPNLTGEGMAVGTPHYISPEQARGERDVDARSDLYSLGATLYRMATGHIPFEGPDAMTIMTRHVTTAAPNPRKFNPELSTGLAQLILRLMAKRREDRPASAQALLEEIDRLKAPPRPLAKLTAHKPSARPSLAPAFIVSAAVVMLAAVGLFGMNRDKPPEPPKPVPAKVVVTPPEPVIEKPVAAIPEPPKPEAVVEPPTVQPEPSAVEPEKPVVAPPPVTLPPDFVARVEQALAARDVAAARAAYAPFAEIDDPWFRFHRRSIDVLDQVFAVAQMRASPAHDFAATKLPGRVVSVEPVTDAGGRSLRFTVAVGAGSAKLTVTVAPAREGRLLHSDDVLALIRREPEYDLKAGLFLFYEGRLAEARERLLSCGDPLILERLKDVPLPAEEAEAARLFKDLGRWKRKNEESEKARAAGERLLGPLARTRVARENRVQIEAWMAQKPVPAKTIEYRFDRESELDDFEGAERVADGHLVTSATAWWKGRLAGDFSVEATIRPTGEHNVGLVVCSDGAVPAGTGYAMIFRPKFAGFSVPQESLLWKLPVRNMQEGMRAGLGAALAPFQMQKDKPFTVVWTRVGTKMEVSVDGKKIRSADDAAYAEGRLGVYVVDSGARVDTLKITGGSR